MDFNKSIFRVFLRLSSVFLTLFSCIILSGCRYYQDISLENNVHYLLGRKLELQADVFVVAMDYEGRIHYKLHALLGGSHLPKSIEAYERYGSDWYKYDEVFQGMYREDKHQRPHKVVGVLKKGTVLTITKIEKHGGYNYGPIIFIFVDANNFLFKDKKVCLQTIMYSTKEENKAYNIYMNPKYLKLID